jgi:glyoxylase-like metal-dependent hydrolase (beta-lactamase superfamily II)
MRRLILFVLTLAAVAAAAVVGMRWMRARFSEASEIKPGLYGVKSGGGIYLYAARVGEGLYAFDTGADPGARPVDALLAALKGGHDDVRAIFMTHGHFDHIAGATQFPQARTYLGVQDVGLASGAIMPDALAAMVLTKAMQIPPVTITNPMKGRATFSLSEGKTVEAFPVPGHTAGSFAFLFDGVLFPGDIMILKEGRLEPTPAAFDAHPAQNRSAIRALKAQLDNETLETVCTAHGGCTPKGLGRSMLNDLVERIGAS